MSSKEIDDNNKTGITVFYINLRDTTKDLMSHVIIAHTITDTLMDKMIKKYCKDSKITASQKEGCYTYTLKLAMLQEKCIGQILPPEKGDNNSYSSKLNKLHGLELIPDNLFHNLDELNSLRNDYAHYLELRRDEITYYEDMRSQKFCKCSVSDPDINFNIEEFLCSRTVQDLINHVYDHEIDTRYTYKNKNFNTAFIR
jgi:hypothetical protein